MKTRFAAVHESGSGPQHCSRSGGVSGLYLPTNGKVTRNGLMREYEPWVSAKSPLRQARHGRTVLPRG
jgi:hypothetical protein